MPCTDLDAGPREIPNTMTNSRGLAWSSQVTAVLNFLVGEVLICTGGWLNSIKAYSRKQSFVLSSPLKGNSSLDLMRTLTYAYSSNLCLEEN